MKKLVSARLAGNILLISMVLLEIFHVLILFGVVPSDIVWGGEIKNSSANLITLELVAVFVTLVFIIIIAAKIGYLKLSKINKLINVGVWFVFGYLILNTIGNLASDVNAEKLIFAPITIILTFFAYRLAIEK